MRGNSWIRIVLCGVVAGVVWYLLSALSLSLFAQDLLEFVERGGPYPRLGGAFFFVVDLMMGIWAMWLYTAIAPRYGAGPTTAAIAGIAWWTIKTLQSAKWAGLGFLPRGAALIPLATTLVAVLVASMLGAWLYDRVDRPATKWLRPRPTSSGT
ncbi:MAG TPA: hypothetical protein VEY33_05130 [Gemmatimonadota bacterium]|nr:hypothetical protein [Gemmatimonadota bacterium]